MNSDPTPRRRAGSGWYLLLMLPFLGLLTPVYLKAEPTLGGFPFFYWYQMLWILLSSALTWIVYVATRESAP